MLITQNGTTLEYLIAATKQLLDEGGVKAVTLREVGKRARVSHNAVYRHFTNRHALLAAVAELDLDDLRLLFTDALAPNSDTPLAELLVALRHLLVFARGRPARYRLFFSDADVAMRNGSTQQKASAALDALATLIQACQDAGRTHTQRSVQTRRSDVRHGARIDRSRTRSTHASEPRIEQAGGDHRTPPRTRHAQIDTTTRYRRGSKCVAVSALKMSRTSS